jgi:hypothetical protein
MLHKLKNRYTMLGVTTLLAAVVGLAQAATASASEFYLQEPLAPGTPGKVLNAYACGNPANIVQWNYQSPGTCNSGGSNEIWYSQAVQSGGATPIYAEYGGHRMCMNVDRRDYASGTQIIAYNCDSGFTDNEWFTMHQDPNAQNNWTITPTYEASGANLCLNVAGGFGNGNNIILYSCGPPATNPPNNEWFSPQKVN